MTKLICCAVIEAGKAGSGEARSIQAGASASRSAKPELELEDELESEIEHKPE